MKTMMFMMRGRRLLVALAVVLGVALSVSWAMPPRAQLVNAIYSSVFIVSLNDDGQPLARGSGTILDPKGLILTNFHVVANDDQSDLCNKQGIVAVLMTRDPRENAVPTYLAKVVRYDPKLDLATIQVITDMQGNALTRPPMLSSISVGNSDTLFPGDAITVVGYPGLGAGTVTITNGSVSGFITDENKNTLMKTDAEINPGNSGGTALNDAGELIGVPTFTSEGKERTGKIGLIRPINLAKPLLSEVSGVQPTDRRNAPTNPQAQTPQTPGLGQAPQAKPPQSGTRVEFVGFTTSSEETQAVASAPSGTRELYAHFKFTGATRRTTFSSVWSFNGQKIDKTAYSKNEWPFDVGDGAARVYIQSEGALPDGVFGLEILVNGQKGEWKINVGGSAGGTEGQKANPLNRPAAQSARLRGRVTSADNGRPLNGAALVILKPGITFGTWDKNNPDHLLEVSRTGADGRFETKVALNLDTEYSLFFVAQGYEPAAGEGLKLRKLYEGNPFIDLGEIGLKAAQ